MHDAGLHQREDDFSEILATVDVPGAFMQADADELIYLRLTDEMVDSLLSIDHDTYAPYVVEEKGRKVLYAKLLKALYGTLKAA